MKLLSETQLKHRAGYRAGCLCRFTINQWDPQRPRCARTPVMGCPVHEAKTPITVDGHETDAAGLLARVLAPSPPPPSLPPFVHGRLGEAEPGRLFHVVCDGPNDITLTGQGLALRMDRATLAALSQAVAEGLRHLVKGAVHHDVYGRR